MAVNNVYRVVYHFEKGGKRVSDTASDFVIAADSTYGSLNTVLANNGKTNNGVGSLAIETFTHVGSSHLS